MIYVFYETGSDDFFKRIVEVFSSIFAWFVFITVFNEVLQPGGRVIDKTRNGKLETAINNYKKTLKALNCALFPAIPVCCGNQQCKNGHKIVLASDQVAFFETAIEDKKKALAKESTYIGDKRARYNMQDVFENFKIATCTKEVFEHIVINSQAHPGLHSIEYKRDKPVEYKQAYIRQAKEIRDRTGTEMCVYVRAGTNTEYAWFENNMRATSVKVKPCDEFQAV
jgi:N-acetylneuraminic acid mutarotase